MSRERQCRPANRKIQGRRVRKETRHEDDLTQKEPEVQSVKPGATKDSLCLSFQTTTRRAKTPNVSFRCNPSFIMLLITYKGILAPLDNNVSKEFENIIQKE